MPSSAECLEGAIAWLLGESFLIAAMLSAIAGPLLIFGANRLLDIVPIALPGKESGVHQFLLFSICVAIAVAILRLAS